MTRKRRPRWDSFNADPNLGFQLDDVPQPGPWIEHGACRTAPTDLFFPERGQNTEPAKAICDGCPVKQECLNYALSASELQGIWGGTSGRQRRRMRVDGRVAA